MQRGWERELRGFRGGGLIHRERLGGATPSPLGLRFYAEPRRLIVELTAEAIVELFRADARARKELAELLVSEPDVRLVIINAVLRDVATKSDIEQLRADFGRDIEQLRTEFRRELEQLRTEFRREIDTLAREIDRLYKLVIVSVLGILISIANTILVRLLLPP